MLPGERVKQRERRVRARGDVTPPAADEDDSLLEQQSYKEALAAYRRAMQAVAEDAAGAVAQACGRQIKRVLAHMGLPEDDQDDSEQLPLDGTTG